MLLGQVPRRPRVLPESTALSLCLRLQHGLPTGVSAALPASRPSMPQGHGAGQHSGLLRAPRRLPLTFCAGRVRPDQAPHLIADFLSSMLQSQ